MENYLLTLMHITIEDNIIISVYFYIISLVLSWSVPTFIYV